MKQKHPLGDDFLITIRNMEREMHIRKESERNKNRQKIEEEKIKKTQEREGKREMKRQKAKHTILQTQEALTKWYTEEMQKREEKIKKMEELLEPQKENVILKAKQFFLEKLMKL